MNKTRIHDEIEDWMSAALCEVISPEDKNCFEEHLAKCANCRTLFQEEQKINMLLNTTFAKVHPDPRFEQRILARFRNQTARSGFRLTQWLIELTQARPFQAACAVLLLAAMVKSGALLTGGSNGELMEQSVQQADRAGLSDTPMVNAAAARPSDLKGGSFGKSEIAGKGQAPALRSPGAATALALNETDQQSGASGLSLMAAGVAPPTPGGFTSEPSLLPGSSGVPTNTPAMVDARKLIRNASLTLEVVSCEKAQETITAIASEESGYIATQSSGRRVNGKSEGTIVVKVPPAQLDSFLKKLLPLGDLKNQNIATEDVTAAYFDTDARLRNSKRMETRLLEMLEKNTGKVSDLLQVEKELSRVRGEIEQMQGQLKLYDSLTAYATVTISLTEKDLNQPAAFLLREHANLSLFSKDVEKTFTEAKAVANAAKAQTIESRIERNSAGQISATLHLLFTPETADAAILRIKTLGRIQSFNSQTDRVARNGSGNSDSATIERDKVELNLVIQHDAESASQQTRLAVQTDRVEEKVAQIKQEAAMEGIEIKNVTFNRTSDGVEVSNLSFRMPLQKSPAFLAQIKKLGSVKDFTVNRNDDTALENSPAEIALQIFSQGNIVPEENGLLATVRKTLAQGVKTVMWSIQMICVSLAFIAPWGVILGGVIWFILRRRNR